EEPPGLGEPAQLVRAAVLEGEARAGDEVGDRARHPHLPGVGQPCHPGRQVHADAGHVPAPPAHLGGVEPAGTSSPSGATASRRPSAPRTARPGPSKVESTNSTVARTWSSSATAAGA